MGPGSAIAAVLLAAGITSAGGRTLQIPRKARVRSKRRDTRRKSKETGG